MTITALAYKPDWTESHMGCITDGGSSDFQFKVSEDNSDIAEFIATCKFNQKVEGGEYEFTILFNGKEASQCDGDEFVTESVIMLEASSRFDQKWKEWQEQKKAQEQAKAAQQQKAAEDRERAELVRLQQKYGDPK